MMFGVVVRVAGDIIHTAFSIVVVARVAFAQFAVVVDIIILLLPSLLWLLHMLCHAIAIAVAFSLFFASFTAVVIVVATHVVCGRFFCFILLLHLLMLLFVGSYDG
jgi:hypothetical protein